MQPLRSRPHRLCLVASLLVGPLACSEASDSSPQIGGIGTGLATRPSQSEAQQAATVPASWPLAGRARLLRSEIGELSLEQPDNPPMALGRCLGEPVVDESKTRLLFARLEQPPATELVAYRWSDGRWRGPRLLSDEGSPDRPAISADGRTVAFVSARTGISAIWTMPFDGDAATQLTNRGVQLAPRLAGRAPDGFVPVPHRGALRIEAGWVVWESAEGAHRVELP